MEGEISHLQEVMNGNCKLMVKEEAFYKKTPSGKHAKKKVIDDNIPPLPPTTNDAMPSSSSPLSMMFKGSRFFPQIPHPVLKEVPCYSQVEGILNRYHYCLGHIGVENVFELIHQHYVGISHSLIYVRDGCIDVVNVQRRE